HAHRFALGGKLSNLVLLDVDNLPERLGAAPTADAARAKPVTAPAVLNGRIDRPGHVDHWAVTAGKGEVYELDLRAGRLGSPLDGVLTVLDAAGKELARADSPAPGQPDPLLRFTAPADGTYLVRVQDRFRSR